MTELSYRTALIVGVGAGLSASLARTFTKAGMKVALAARRAAELAPLAKEIGGKAFACDATKPAEVAKLFADVEADFGAPDVVVYNASYRTRGPFVELDPAEVEKSLSVTAFGGFLVAQEAAKRMLPRSTARSCSPARRRASRAMRSRRRSPWASSRCAALAQSLARELAPQGIHVAHVVIDGGIRSAEPGRSAGTSPTACSIPTPLRRAISHLLQQHRSAWAWEIELRPWVERF